MGRLDLVEALNTRVVGRGDSVVVLAHGFGSTQSLWDEVYPSLLSHHPNNTNDLSHPSEPPSSTPPSPNFRVVLFDWPGGASTARNLDGLTMRDLADIDANVHPSSREGHGHGHAHGGASIFSDVFHSFPRILLALLSRLRIHSNVSFVGHSMSALIGCVAAQLRPSLFRKLVLVASSPMYLNEPGTDYIGGFDPKGMKMMYEAMDSDFKGWAASFAPVAAGPGNHETANWFLRNLSGMRKEVAIDMAKCIFETDNRQILDNLIASVANNSNTNYVSNPIDDDGDDDDDDGDGDVLYYYSNVDHKPGNGYHKRAFPHHHNLIKLMQPLELHIVQSSKDMAVPQEVNEYLKERLMAFMGPAQSVGCREERLDKYGTMTDYVMDARRIHPLTAYRYVNHKDNDRIVGSLCILDTECGGHFPQISSPLLFNSALLFALHSS